MSMLVASTGKPDSCWSWVVCICAALSQAMTMGFLFSFGVLFPVFMEYFRETREKTGECHTTTVSLVGFVFGAGMISDLILLRGFLCLVLKNSLVLKHSTQTVCIQ